MSPQVDLTAVPARRARVASRRPNTFSDLRARLGARRPSALAIWAVALGCLLYLNRDLFLTPLVVSYSAAHSLVMQDRELANTRQRTADYRDASRFFDTPQGRDYARKLMYSQPSPGERVMRIVPGDGQALRGTKTRVREWVDAGFAQLGTGYHLNVAILHRWLSNPPARAS